MKYWTEAWQLQAKGNTQWRQCGCSGGADTQSRWLATHQILREMGHSHSQSFVVVITHCDLGLKCLKRFHMQELNEANCHVFITPDLWSPQSHDLSRSSLLHLANNSATSRPDKSAGCEWMEAASDWCVDCSGTQYYWQCHCMTSGTDVSTTPAFEPEEDRTFWIFMVIQISQNIVYWNKCNVNYNALTM